MSLEKIGMPSFRIDPKTQEVCIPYDQFHTWINDVAQKLDSIQAILGLQETDAESLSAFFGDSAYSAFDEGSENEH